MRYERKFRIENSNYEKVSSIISNNPFAFKVRYPNRIVNSIYYDTIDYIAYNENLLGISNRIKYRIRWYGNKFKTIENPTLEKKIKQNLLGTKEYLKINAFDLNEGAPKLNPSNGIHLEAMVLVQYERTYLESYDHTIRATIDRRLKYSSLSGNKLFGPSVNDDALILEIKYDQSNFSYAIDCIQAIPYRMTKNSKYVSAMRHFLQ